MLRLCSCPTHRVGGWRMTGRPFHVDWNPEDTAEALRTAYRAERDTMLRTRLRALWPLRSVRRVREAASVVGVHYRTLQRWVSWYRTRGLDEVGAGRFRTGVETRDWIESEYGAGYTPGSVYSLLARLGCSPRAPRGLHEKADLRARESWKRGDLARRSGARE